MTLGRGRGLTLVEVLVAVVVCGAGLALVAAGISGAVRAESYAQGLTSAADHAELLLGRLEAGVLPLEDAAGDFTDDGAPELSWEVRLTPGEVEGLQVARLTVSWTSLGVERDLVVERQLFVDPLEGGIQ